MNQEQRQAYRQLRALEDIATALATFELAMLEEHTSGDPDPVVFAAKLGDFLRQVRQKAARALPFPEGEWITLSSASRRVAYGHVDTGGTSSFLAALDGLESHDPDLEGVF